LFLLVSLVDAISAHVAPVDVAPVDIALVYVAPVYVAPVDDALVYHVAPVDVSLVDAAFAAAFSALLEISSFSMFVCNRKTKCKSMPQRTLSS